MKAFLKSKAVIITASCLAAVLTVFLLLEAGHFARENYSPWMPDYEKEDIYPILSKESLTDEDYEKLFLQTGLTKLGIDSFREKGQLGRIITVQEQFFSEQDVYTQHFAPLMGIVKREGDSAVAAPLEKGDILYSPSTFFSFFKIGHSAIVVDDVSGSFIQAQGYGAVPVRLPKVMFFERPIFVILRPKADKEVRDGAADLVKDELMDTAYGLSAGIFGPKAPDELVYTHCSHLVWYAYYKQGVDIDSNGGKIVTPHDFLASDELEIVQVLGMDPRKLLKK